jgi:pyruvate formate lyase activating enzyme
MEAMYYEKRDDKIVKCKLCPHGCIIRDGDMGVCRVRENSGGTLISLNYGKIASFAYDPIEKKPLYHFYPGSKILSIGTYGCNLKCDFCQNWEISQKKSMTMELEDEDILLMAKSRGSIGIAYTYNEPSISYEYVLHLCKLVKSRGLKNVLVTNGYINEEPLKELLPYVDAMNIDLKSIEDGFYRRICKGKLEPVMNTIKMAAKQVHVEITNLIIDGLNSSEDQIDRLAKWISKIDDNIPLHLTKYFPAYRMNLPPTSYDTLMRAKKTAEKHLKYVYVGNVMGIDRNTYCPSCSYEVVNRSITGQITGIKDGKCSNCGHAINMVY